MMESREQDRVVEHEQEHDVPEYERPRVTDYGTLIDMTRAGNFPNADVPGGADGTAFSPA
jgi:hypothetical protein